MSIRIDLLRPDDLLNLRIEGENLRLDTSAADAPALVLDDASKPGYLIVVFPPQTVVEEAVYESSPTPPLESPTSALEFPPPKPEKDHPLNVEHPPPSEPSRPSVRSRIGGSSRLVFRIPAEWPQSIPYTLEGLLDWSALELNVSALADVPAEPSAQQRNTAPAITKPGARDTAIELPYRLILSPNHSVGWAHVRGLQTRQGIAELWHTRLMLKADDGKLSETSRANPAPLRAIWSPDFKSQKFLGTEAPLFGDADEDWGPPDVLTPMTPCDRHEIVVLTSAFSGYVKDKDDFTSYEPRPVNGEQLMLSPLGGWLKSRGEWDPPAPYRLPRFTLADEIQGWSQTLAHLTDLRRAPDRDRAALAPDASSSPPDDEASASIADDDVGAARRAESRLVSTAAITGGPGFEAVLWPRLLGTTGDLLNVSEWSHIATMGRDHFVRIVYEGHLFPTCHRAALIKITERKIRDVPNSSSTPVAYLAQRMFIVVRQPMRNYEAPEVHKHLEHGGRGLPLRSIRLTTLVTPDIANPNDTCKVFPGNGSIFSFWVRLGAGASVADDFKFHAVAEDIAGDTINFNCSLIFIPFGESLVGRNAVRAQYDKSGEARACIVPGQKLTYAPKGGKDNTTLTTQKLYFTSQPAPFNKTFGAFLPKLFKSSCKLPAVEALLGAPAETEIAFHAQYLDNLPGNTTGLFARVVKEGPLGTLTDNTLAAEFEAKKAGGFATPNLSISGLTRELGPMAGNAAKIAADQFDPADFFKDMKDSAKLFGTFSLAELLENLTMTAGAPKVQIQQSELPPGPLLRLTKFTTTLDWAPKVKGQYPAPGGIVKFFGNRDNQDAEFVVQARIEKTISVPPVSDPAPPTRRHERRAHELPHRAAACGRDPVRALRVHREARQEVRCVSCTRFNEAGSIHRRPGVCRKTARDDSSRTVR